MHCEIMDSPNTFVRVVYTVGHFGPIKPRTLLINRKYFVLASMYENYSVLQKKVIRLSGIDCN